MFSINTNNIFPPSLPTLDLFKIFTLYYFRVKKVPLKKKTVKRKSLLKKKQRKKSRKKILMEKERRRKNK